MLLQACFIPTFYNLKKAAGITSAILQILKNDWNAHNTGKVTATKNKGPWKVVFFETCETKAAANSRELYIKSMKSRAFIERLVSKS